jgi:hypothetical protein
LVAEYQSREKRASNTSQESISTSSSTLGGSKISGKKVNWSCNFSQFVQDTSSNDCVKSELDYYLEELVLLNESNVDKFDILGYYKNIGVRYPTLQKIAKDLLAILISIVALESAFSIRG